METQYTWNDLLLMMDFYKLDHNMSLTQVLNTIQTLNLKNYKKGKIDYERMPSLPFEDNFLPNLNDDDLYNLMTTNRELFGRVTTYLNRTNRNREILSIFLIKAIKENNIQIARMLIEVGANVNIQNDYGDTPLIMATNKGGIYLVELLINAGADIDIQDTNGDTALLSAIYNDYEDITKMWIIVNLLIDAGANVNIQDEYSGNTALINATKNDYKEIVKLLIDANADVNIRNVYGDTALMFAAMKGNKDIVKLLIDAGANVNIKNYQGVSALIKATFYNYPEVVRTLLKYGADPNIT